MRYTYRAGFWCFLRRGDIDVEIRAYKGLPEEAMDIREEVFCREQGFKDEFDQIDEHATHLLLFDDGHAVATCRIFAGDEPGEFILGRLAVRKAFRGSKLGAAIIAGAEKEALRQGGAVIKLHSQMQAKGFYEKQGYVAYGPVEPDQGCPHIWMKKELSEGAQA